jgi:transcriptional regulator with XRE-family HTH domain
MHAEAGAGMSQAYLSQLESGARMHLSAHSRDLLARFFKVHPGYLVDDPPNYQAELGVAHLLPERDLRDWLANRADEQQADPVLHRVLLRLSRQEDPRRLLALLDDLLDQPVDQLEAAVRRALCWQSDAAAAEGVAVS